jgi:hypothetical protein
MNIEEISHTMDIFSFFFACSVVAYKTALYFYKQKSGNRSTIL